MKDISISLHPTLHLSSLSIKTPANSCGKMPHPAKIYYTGSGQTLLTALSRESHRLSSPAGTVGSTPLNRRRGTLSGSLTATPRIPCGNSADAALATILSQPLSSMKTKSLSLSDKTQSTAKALGISGALMLHKPVILPKPGVFGTSAMNSSIARCPLSLSLMGSSTLPTSVGSFTA